MNTEKIKVSVIVITYNQHKYIKKALDSILEQKTTFDFEVLVGDDASTDGTDKYVIAASKNPRVIPVLRKENIGPVNNMLDLQKRACGEFIAYLDGDDYWCDENKLQIQVQALEKSPEFIACVHRCHVVDINGNFYHNQTLPWIVNKPIFTIYDFKGIVLPGHLSTLMHRNFFDKNSFTEYGSLMLSHPIIGDRSLYLYLLSKTAIIGLPQTMSCYRKQDCGENATSRIYGEVLNAIREDYEYTLRLEEQSRKILHIDAGFRYRKRDIFANAVCVFLKNPQKKSWHLVTQILKGSSILDCLIHLPERILYRLYKKLL